MGHVLRPKTAETFGQDSEILSHEELGIATEDDVVTVRQRVRSLAQDEDFDSFAIAALTTAASELARNIWAHAGKGNVEIERFKKGGKLGIRLKFADLGPGIPDIDRVMRGGYSTGRSLGLGLSGTKRLVDEFEIRSTVGKGTEVRITKWCQTY